MPKYFIITGLPRSRTAWLAALFCNGNVICFHEPVNNFSSLKEMKEFLDTLPYEYVGISDSSIGFYEKFYTDNFKDAPIVVIDRIEEEAKIDLAYFLDISIDKANELIRKLDSGLEDIKQRAKIFNFRELNNNDVVEQVWNALIPSIPFDKLRCELFQTLMIQQHKEKVFKNLK